MCDNVKVIFHQVIPNTDEHGSEGARHTHMELKPYMIPNVGDYMNFPDKNGKANNNPFTARKVLSKQYVYSEDDNRSYILVYLD